MINFGAEHALMQLKNIGTEKAWQKIKHYCAYQERSHTDTRNKLYSFGLYKNEVEQLLSRLIEENRVFRVLVVRNCSILLWSLMRCVISPIILVSK